MLALATYAQKCRNAAALNGKSCATFRTRRRFVETAAKFLQRFRQISRRPAARPGVVLSTGAMNDHHRQCAFRTGKTIQYSLLMQPVGFAQQPLYAVPACSFCMAAGRKSDLDGRIYLELRTRHYPVHKPNAPFADRTDIFPATVEQGANQALPLEAE